MKIFQVHHLFRAIGSALIAVLVATAICIEVYAAKSNSDFVGSFIISAYHRDDVFLLEGELDGINEAALDLVYTSIPPSSIPNIDFIPGIGSYDVQPDGTFHLVYDGGHDYGIVNSDNTIAASVSVTDRADMSFAVKKTAGKSNSSLTGDYFAVVCGTNSSIINDLSFDGNGGVSAKFLYASDNDLPPPLALKYTVEPDGQFLLDLSIVNQKIRGNINGNGDILNAVNLDYPEILVAIKKPSGLSAGDIQGEYISTVYSPNTSQTWVSLVTFDGNGNATSKDLYSFDAGGAVSSASVYSHSYSFDSDGTLLFKVRNYAARGIISQDTDVIAGVSSGYPVIGILIKKGSGFPAWYKDLDGDGFGDPSDLIENDTQPLGYVTDGTDCDDTDMDIYPGADEICEDGIDQDCDGDDGDCPKYWHADADKDGFGNPNVYKYQAIKPLNTVLDDTDCDDTNPGIYPGAVEILNDGIDQDCDGNDLTGSLEGALISDPASGLAPLTVEFHTLITQGQPPFSYHYKYGDGNENTDGVQDETHTYTVKGNYQAKVIVTDGLGLTKEFTVDVDVVDQADLVSYGTNINTSIVEMGKVAEAGEIPGILSDAALNIGGSLAGTKNVDDVAKKAVKEIIQDKSNELISNTKEKLGSFVANDLAAPEDVTDISIKISGLVSDMVQNEVPVLEETVTNLKEISGDIFISNVETVVASKNLSPGEVDQIKKDPAKSRQFFTDNMYLLDDAVGKTGVKVDATKDFELKPVENLAAKHGLNQQQAASLYTTIESTIDTEQVISENKDSVTSKNIAQIAQEIFNAYGSGKTVLNSEVDPLTRNIRMEFSDGTSHSLNVKDVSIIKDNYPPGLHDLPDGSKLGVTDTYAMSFVPYPAHPFDLNAALIKSGLIPETKKNGALTVETLYGILSIKTGWSYFADNLFQKLTTSFSVVGGSDPSAEAYAILVTFDQGKSQLLPPAVYAMDSLVKMLDGILEGGYFFNTDTGALTMGAFKYKPDYLFLPLTQIDYPAIKASGGVVFSTLAFEIKDYNNDSLPDLKYYSDNPKGSQILYAVSNAPF